MDSANERRFDGKVYDRDKHLVVKESKLVGPPKTGIGYVPRRYKR